MRSRAQSCVNYLVSKGIPTDKITSVGKGKASPVASNDSPEGRANNRRVEIVVGGNSSGRGNGADVSTTK